MIANHTRSNRYVRIPIMLMFGAATAGAFAIPVETDFRQDQNNDNGSTVVAWDGTINSQSGKYFEGMSVPQRVILLNIAATLGDVHVLTLQHDAGQTTGGNQHHAYDFLTSWQQAKQAGGGVQP